MKSAVCIYSMTTTTTSSSTSGSKKMSGLSGLLTSASEADMLAASLALGKIDPIRELGLDLEMARYNTRLEALSDPKAYETKRETAFTEMIGHVRKSYDDAYKGVLGAGMSTDMAKGSPFRPRTMKSSPVGRS